MTALKACPVVVRLRIGVEVLAFEHPLAGRQLVKGTVEPGESPAAAAVRELTEEAGIDAVAATRDLGVCSFGDEVWSFHLIATSELPDRWEHRCADDGGHVFRFFWQPLDAPGLDGWQEPYASALSFLRLKLQSVSLDLP